MICFDGLIMLWESMDGNLGHWMIQRLKEPEFGFWENFIGYRLGMDHFHRLVHAAHLWAWYGAEAVGALLECGA